MEGITVTMPIETYESMKEDIEHWKFLFDDLLRTVSRHVELNDSGESVINDCAELAGDVENFLNDYDW